MAESSPACEVVYTLDHLTSSMHQTLVRINQIVTELQNSVKTLQSRVETLQSRVETLQRRRVETLEQMALEQAARKSTSYCMLFTNL